MNPRFEKLVINIKFYRVYRNYNIYKYIKRLYDLVVGIALVLYCKMIKSLGNVNLIDNINLALYQGATFFDL